MDPKARPTAKDLLASKWILRSGSTPDRRGAASSSDSSPDRDRYNPGRLKERKAGVGGMTPKRRTRMRPLVLSLRAQDAPVTGPDAHRALLGKHTPRALVTSRRRRRLHGGTPPPAYDTSAGT